MTYEEAKRDSTEKSKHRFNPINSSRRRDSITIHKIGRQ